MIKIRSISDVISNSSNEAFCFKLDEDFEKLQSKSGLGDLFTIIRNLNDVKKVIWPEEEWKTYESWEDFTSRYAQCEHGHKPCPKPIRDVFQEWETLRNGDTNGWDNLTEEEKDELWEENKHLYEPVVGYAYALLNNEGGNPCIEEICNLWREIWANRQIDIVKKTFKPNTFYVSEEGYIIHHVKKGCFDSAMRRKRFIPDDEVTHNKHDREDLLLVLNLIQDYGKVSEATEREREKIKKAAREAGFDYRNGKLIKR